MINRSGLVFIITLVILIIIFPLQAGATVRCSFLNFTMDHLFIKGLDVIATGTAETLASDHRPLWVWLKLPEDADSQ